ncbi:MULTISPECIES: type II toxin-antitoxin system VapC family toxin [Paraburkholderia]|jgi:PIN domain nuclease of toxin-antitoxin system|uniref:PIN domain nuclease of toxin-antitoxin system n=1 Tax=Paraburkholderia youngii TaxID=2782701 RepID=A0A7W8P2U4_9BURK|nr:MULTISPECIES: PIN domain-containing protein [Paraburkholderia]MBB5399463.1 PIN domain nuclease of toxin-antitoxin system [Paraburkholderia youngii]MBB5415743.1 PIN domain nuclease of toxin-antitoxin system [Paraburkholderia atlantica]
MIVLDTCALLLWLCDQGKLSVAAREAVERGMEVGEVAISSISVLDVGKFIEDGRLALSVSTRSWLLTLATIEGMRVIPVDFSIAVRAANISVPLTSHQKVIVATTIALGGALITPDAYLRTHTYVDSIW